MNQQLVGKPGMRLGLLPRPAGVKAPLLFSSFLQKKAPPAPEKVYREYKIPEDAWGMFDNDTVGDCTCAAIAHMLMLVTSHTGKMVVPDRRDVISFYSAVSGFNLETGENDNGADLASVLNRWQHVGLSGHKILAWADIDPQNIEHQKQGIYIFGATDDGIQMPISAMNQFGANLPWSVDEEFAAIEGGHSVPRFGYGHVGAKCVTWGKLQGATWEWWMKYLFECCVVITKDWINEASGLAPNSMDLDALRNALKALKA